MLISIKKYKIFSLSVAKSNLSSNEEDAKIINIFKSQSVIYETLLKMVKNKGQDDILESIQRTLKFFENKEAEL